ncbi:hypothetical protein [Marinobacter adhaerens]|jgi:hypothetical protein|uniref:hypothetical protein n=1 Tax=Marinobacter adhaerens TaxID=1033846 RepID=UPI00114CD747|nr:hypothetical protein [Marinobacter adhaerens]MTI77747.1 hypothetical protein [Marinobacter sp.]
MTPTDPHRGIDQESLGNRKIIHEEAKSWKSRRWLRSTRNWAVTGTLALNPSKLQEVDAVSLPLKCSNSDNWVENRRIAQSTIFTFCGLIFS